MFLLLMVSAVATTNTIFTDLDGDGDLDVFLEVLLENTGGGNFTFKNASDGIGNIPNITQGYFVNVDGDGDEDLYIRRDGFQNFLYRNNGDETFTNITNTSLGRNLTGDSARPSGTVFADFDNDGDVDAFVGGVFFVSTASFADVNGTNVSNLDEVGNLSEVVAVDLNLDGLLDLVGVNTSGGLVMFLNRNDSNGDGVPEFYEATRDMQLHTRTGVNNVAVGDVEVGLAVNQSQSFFPFVGESPPFIVDAFNDLYLARAAANELFIQLFPQPRLPFRLLNRSGFYIPRFIERSSDPINDSGNSSAAIIADFDNNTVNDILVGNRGGPTSVYLRNGSSWFASFVRATANFSNVTNDTKMIQAADLTGNGLLDVAGIDESFVGIWDVLVAGSLSFDVTAGPSSPSEMTGIFTTPLDTLGAVQVVIDVTNVLISGDLNQVNGVTQTIKPDSGHTLFSPDTSSTIIEGTFSPEPSTTPSVGGGGGGGASFAGYDGICPTECRGYAGANVVPVQCQRPACYELWEQIVAEAPEERPTPTFYERYLPKRSVTENIINTEMDENIMINVVEWWYRTDYEGDVESQNIIVSNEAWEWIVVEKPVFGNTINIIDSAWREEEIVIGGVYDGFIDKPMIDAIVGNEPGVPASWVLPVNEERNIINNPIPYVGTIEEEWNIVELLRHLTDPLENFIDPEFADEELPKDCVRRVKDLRASVGGKTAPAEVWEFFDAYEAYLNGGQMDKHMMDQLHDPDFMDLIGRLLGPDALEQLRSIERDCVTFIVVVGGEPPIPGEQFADPEDETKPPPVSDVIEPETEEVSEGPIPFGANGAPPGQYEEPAPRDEEGFGISVGEEAEGGYQEIG